MTTSTDPSTESDPAAVHAIIDALAASANVQAARFSWAETARQTLAVYRKVIA